ncbi:hypothetical protein H2200_007648 [Cladophialophora chaetospira]|uniref:Uncharacterized protein n=1 Tax=Cladophialophora chaetospira TaxID=386627 RepID=A0AA39CGT2_9EURO|nr:hypothetical protein H2200_007648 [Cladophialophora chaetospira]
MVQSAVWPEESVRELVDWVEDHKGPESQLIKNNKEALRTIKNYLTIGREGRESYDFGLGKKELPMTAVRRKLEEIWELRLESLKSSNIGTFYLHGTNVLDWEKVGRSASIGGAYTAEDIAIYKRRVANANVAPQNSLSDTVSEQRDTDALENPSTRSHVSLPEEIDLADPEHRDKRRRTGNNPEAQPTEGSRSETVGERRNASPLQAHDLHANPTSRHAGTGSVKASRAGISADTRLPAQDEGRPIPHWAAPNLSVIGNPHPIEPRSTSKGSDSTGPFYFLNERRGQMDDPWVEPRDAIQLAMESISSRIQHEAGNMILAAGIPTNQPAILDKDFAYPAECMYILSRLLGPTGYDSLTGSEMFSIFHRTNTPLSRFLRSFVACAITTWCFECRIDEEAYHANLGGGEVRRTFEKAFEPMLLAEMRQRLWREHLNTSVKPKIVGEAHRMACLLQTYLEFFIPSNKPPKKRSIGLDEKYSFTWPSFWAPYSPDKHQVPGAQDSAQEAEQPKECQVLLTVMPMVSRMLRKRIGEDDWTDWQTVCKGQVLRL